MRKDVASVYESFRGVAPQAPLRPCVWMALPQTTMLDPRLCPKQLAKTRTQRSTANYDTGSSNIAESIKIVIKNNGGNVNPCVVLT